MKRREFVGLIGGAAAAWPMAARAQQPERMRRIGILTGTTDDPRMLGAIAVLREELAKRGWAEGRNLQLLARFGGGDPDRFRSFAAELVAAAPDVIVTASAAATRVLQQQTQTIPIVITGAGDPATNDIVRNIGRPEGNTTGITNLYASIGGKWLELLKEVAPRLQRVGLVYNDRLGSGPDGGIIVYAPSIEDAARVMAVQSVMLPYRDALDIVRGFDTLAREPDTGLIMVPPAATAANRETIFRLASQHRLPIIVHDRDFVLEGALLSYGSDTADRFRRAGAYVDRLLRGAKVNELPVQFPTRFELAVNLKVAKGIGLTIPESFLVRADEVIE
jgi:putative ABC transport system substrate-binding protein